MSAPLKLPPLIDEVKTILPAGQPAHLVGGAVRDLLLGRGCQDFDFAVPANGVGLARRVANALHADFNVLDRERDIGRVILSGSGGERTLLDFAAYRNGPALEGDLAGRDLTINAMAYDLHAGSLIDPLNGRADLGHRMIRAASPSAFQDDPARVLRAVRLASELEFQIESQTRVWLLEAAPGLEAVSAERVRDEAMKLLENSKPHQSLRALDALGALQIVFPELRHLKGVPQPAPHVLDVWEHTLSLLEHLEQIVARLRGGDVPEASVDRFESALNAALGRFSGRIVEHLAHRLNPERTPRGLLFFSALYHDVSKPETRSQESSGRIRFIDHEQKGAEVAAWRAGALRLSNEEIERVRLTVANHMRFHSLTWQLETEGGGPSRKAIYRFFRDAGRAGIDLVLLGLADVRAIQGEDLSPETWDRALRVANALLENYWEKPEESIAPPRLLSGDDLMREFGLEPGPALGRLLEALREAQAAGDVADIARALVFAREWLEANPA